MVIVGGGISSFAFVRSLELKSRLPEKIILIKSQARFPPCSQASTALVFPYGIRSEDSAWSKTLIDAVLGFEQFVRADSPSGVVPMRHLIIASQMQDDNEKNMAFVRRWKTAPHSIDSGISAIGDFDGHEESGHHVDVDVFSQYCENFLARLAKEGRLEIVDAAVERVREVGEKLSLEMSDGQVIVAAQSFWGSSYGCKQIDWQGEGLRPFKRYIEHCRPVSGSYLEWGSCPHWVKTPVAWDLNGVHLVMRPDHNLLLLGSTTQDEILMPDFRELESMYACWQEWLAQFKLALPALLDSKVKSGMRFKGQKKRPWLGPIVGENNNHLACVGTYKNGFSLPFL